MNEETNTGREIPEENVERSVSEESAAPTSGYTAPEAQAPQGGAQAPSGGYQGGYQEYQYPSGYRPDWRYAPAWQPPEPPKKKKKGMTAGGIVALCLVCALLGGITGMGGALFIGRRAAASRLNAGSAEDGGKTPVSTMMKGVRENAVLDIEPVDTSAVLTAAEVYAANVRSTVGIQTSVTVTNFWGYPTTAAAAGSGFIISDDGYILTNYHVVEGATSITVTDYDGESHDAVLIGFDAANDVAVLKIEAVELTPVVLGDSEKMNVGDSVVAIGNPLGELTFSLTAGTVSAMDREITMSTGATMDLIQTDCAINSGNSGGALFNMHGEVIGITNAKYSGNGSEASIDNIGFAIPINQVTGIVQSIIEKGYIAKPYIGVSVANVSTESQSYGLPTGAAVRFVEEEGPAAKAGLLENDIITAINGESIDGSDALVDAVGAAQAGDTLELTVYRQGETLTLTVTVGEKIQEALPQPTEQPQQPQQGMDGFGGFPWSQFEDFFGRGW